MSPVIRKRSVFHIPQAGMSERLGRTTRWTRVWRSRHASRARRLGGR